MGNGLSYDELEQNLAALARENAELKTRLNARPGESSHLSPQGQGKEYIFEDLFNIDEIQKSRMPLPRRPGFPQLSLVLMALRSPAPVISAAFVPMSFVKPSSA